MPGPKRRDHRVETVLEIDIAHIPDHAGKQEILNRRVEAELHLPVDAGVERVDRVIEPLELVDCVHRHMAMTMVEISASVSSIRRTIQAGPPRLITALARLVAMISRRRRWSSTAVGNLSGTSRGKYWDSLAGEIRIVRHAGDEQVLVERQLGVGEQHGKLGPCQGLAAPCALGDRGVVGQELHGAAEQAALLERLHQAGEEAGLGHALAFGERERQRLQIVVAQHQRADLVGHRGKQAVAVGRS